MFGGTSVFRNRFLEGQVFGGTDDWINRCLEGQVFEGTGVWRSRCFDRQASGGAGALRSRCLVTFFSSIPMHNNCKELIMLYSFYIKIGNKPCLNQPSTF